MRVAVIFTWDHPADVVSGIATPIARALRELGFDVRLINVMDHRLAVRWPELLGLLEDPDITGCEIALSMGAPPLAIEVEGRRLFDIVGKQFLLFSLDSLFYDVSRVPGAAEFLRSARTSPRLGVLSPDRDSCEVVNRLALHDICSYLPFGGTLRPVVHTDRMARIAVIGTIGYELAVAPATVSCEQLVLEAPRTLGISAGELVQFAREIERPGYSPTITKLATDFLGVPAEILYTVEVAKYLARVDAYQKWRRRKAAVAALRDFPVDFFGSGWEPYTTELRDCRHLGTVSYLQVPEVCQRYRVILNFDPNWGYGLHDRVFTGVANGCRVLTNTSRALPDLSLPDPHAVLAYDVNHPDMSDVAHRALSLPQVDPHWLMGFRQANSWLARMDAFLTTPRGRGIGHPAVV